MTLHIPFQNSFAGLPDGMFARQTPTPVAKPGLLAFNHALAEDLGITGTDDPRLAAYFGGNAVPTGADPLAQLYAGHQFGQFNPQLGDGRAILLGEVRGKDGALRDIQLKGAGQTPFSRRGDGRAWLGPVLREYVVSEAMHALGVPTTRALAAVATGEAVYRETALPGAVLTRVAASHLRVGTFQVYLSRQRYDLLEALFAYAKARHYPEVETPAQFLEAVARKQARLVAQWMGLGFIHGVMNTDNCAISGETIDYGPCAFMDTYHPATVYSSIDRMGRYAYDAQMDIIVWNMAQLATSLVPLCGEDSEATINEFTAILHAMQDVVRDEWTRVFCAKIGIADPKGDDVRLVTSLLQIMQDGQADFTNTFRALLEGKARDQFTDPAAFDAWEGGWRKRLEAEADPQGVMARSNPAFIPRNHRIEQMIEAAVQGDYAPFDRLMRVLARPYDAQPDEADLTRPPTQSEVVQATFCGT
ncbi:protein adenylyltransferase SelO [Pseudoprimorskyibacter insulae]|uniref:Protein nucleotidyltransferase YdiU n=1 Tax=Pseudoprimorskyibacter insulae TaxID=1695997 RepID=A0A2R8AW05_9RHOB|nr:YdiU family protein [Pseudoprimorskyibacter insulae]SPF80203.1 hypothetical protein PRI8871_02009 [Pseudoprimorskyibacter insulae]